MAVRRATRAYGSVVEFLEDYPETLAQGAVFLPPGSYEGELAPELKLDLVVPPLGRLGPIPAQVVHRGADGGVALRIPEWPPGPAERIQELLDSVHQLRAWFVARGELTEADGSAPARPATSQAPRAPQADEPRGRGFLVPDMRGVEPAMTGDCTPKSFQDVLVRLAAERASGLMTFRSPDGRVRYGFWQQGGPVGFRTEPMDEGEVLGVLLYKAKQIDKEQLRESLEIMQRDGVRQGEAFIQMGLMSFPQLVMVLGKQVEFVFQRVLRDTSATWTWHPIEKLPERFLPTPLKVPGMLFRTLFQQAREMKSDSLYDSLTPYLDRYVYLSGKLKTLLADLRFSPLEMRFIETLQANSWRVREIYAVSPLSRAVTAAFLWALIELDLLEFRQEQSDARLAAELRTVLDRKKGQVFSGSLFDVLEVHWICLTDEVDAAFERLKAEYDPSRFKGMSEDEMRDLQKVNAKLVEAHQTLVNETRRREYRRSVIEESKIQQSAELLGRQGDMAVLRNDRRHATACYVKAVELVPGNAEYRAGLARARSLSG